MSLTDLERFKAACAYPGRLDEQAVERELAAFLRALGLSRRIVRLRAGLRPDDDPPPNRSTEWILAECVNRNFRVPPVLAFRRARPFHGTHDDDTDFSSDVLSCRAALAARRASDAGAADAALARHDVLGWAGGFVWLALPLAFLAAFLGAPLPALAVLATLAAVAASVARVAFLDAGVRADLAGVTVLALATTACFFFFAPTVSALVCLGCFAVAALAGVGVYIDRRAGAGDPARAFAGFAATPGAGALRANWRGSTWELSWTVCVLFDAVERGKPAVEARLRPLFEAFVSGCWLIYWTDDALYWVAKPTVRCEPGARRLRLHHDTCAALESDVADLYFWHGAMVPRSVIVRPDLITIAHIYQETNVEVRRAMIERYRHGEEIHGAAAFIRDGGGERLDHHERYGTLWRRRMTGDEFRESDEPIVMIEVANRTPEPDGSFKHYWLRVPPAMRTAREAVAWAFPDFWGLAESAAFSMYRQGDVSIIPVESIPDKLDTIDRENGRVVLAHAEVTGHAHAIKAQQAAVFRDPKLTAVFMTVSGDAPVALEHEDHDTIMIPPGKYQVVRQRQYSPRAVRYYSP